MRTNVLRRRALARTPRLLGLATVAAAASLLLMKTASAQTTGAPANGGFAMNQFEPAPSGDHFFGVPDATAATGTVKPYHPSVMLLGSYALNPLKLHDTSTDTDVSKPVSSLLYLHLDASLALYDRLLLNVDIPFALAASGDGFGNGSSGATSISSGQLADIRLGARLNIVGTYKDPFALGIAGDVWLPTGSQDNLAGDGKARFNPKLIISGLVNDAFVYSATGGFLLRKQEDLGVPVIGDAVTFGAAVGVLVADKKVQIGPEIYGNTYVGGDLGATDTHPNAHNKFLGTHHTPVEAILGAKIRAGDAVIGAGVGPGLSKTPGTPELRGLLSVAWVPQIDEKPKDRDGDGFTDDKDKCPDTPGVAPDGCPAPAPADRDADGIPDATDACPDQPGVRNDDPKKNGCPADRDNDTIPDAVDACPDVAGQADPDPKKNGCPPDRDNDGIPDATDACPDLAGVKSDDPKKNGCPSDRDNDGIYDKDDACPDQPGTANSDPKKNGCPSLAKIEGKEIKIAEQVHFETGKAIIKSDSDALLGEVASILNEHKEISRLVIEGHTDNVGQKNANQILSKKRADAVKDWLVKRGNVDKTRLDSAGYGQTKPLVPNDTDAGRAQNRRVEFHIAGDSVKVPAAAATKATPAVKPPTPKKKLVAASQLATTPRSFGSAAFSFNQRAVDEGDAKLVVNPRG